MSRVHGRCAPGRKCKDAGLIFRFAGPLKGATCPTCGLPLKQTAPALSSAEVRDVERRAVRPFEVQ